MISSTGTSNAGPGCTRGQHELVEIERRGEEATVGRALVFGDATVTVRPLMKCGTDSCRGR